MRFVASVLMVGGCCALASCGGGGSGSTASSGQKPTVSLSVSPATVHNGDTATLNWTSTHANTCTASGSWTGAVATSGSQSIGPLSTKSNYALACSGAGGMSDTASVTVNIVPTAAVTASPAVVKAGGSSTLTWTSTNADSCTASGGWSGTLASSGSQSTGSLASTTTFAVVCSGAGGNSATAQTTVSVADPTKITVSPTVATLTLRQTQQFTATVVGGGGVNWQVDGIAGGNSSVGLISSTGLYTPGTAAGAHVVGATSAVDSSLSATAQAIVTDLAGVFTYHNDLARDGANTQEYALMPASVNTTQFGKLFSCPVDGAIYTQPLWVPNLIVGGNAHNVVFVATAHDGLYAFDADTSPCAQLWSANLIDTAHGANAGETTVPSGPTGNLVGSGSGDITPEVGVIGTPVIDPTTATLYVVSKSVSANHTSFYQRLHAIDLLTGNEKPGSPVLVTGTFPGTGDGGTTDSFNARQEGQRCALALINGVVYIAWASHEDNGPYYGWVLGYTYDGTGFHQADVLNVTPNVQFGGIWMGGAAPAADENNNLYLITGNGGFDANNASTPNNDYGDSLLQISSSLSVLQYFTPTDQGNDNSSDQDFGSGGTAVLADLPGDPVTHIVMGGGKDGTLYVLNRDNLGGYGDAHAVQTISLGYGIFDTGAYWNYTFYIAGLGGPLSAYQLTPSTPSFALGTKSSHTFGFPGSTPSVSAMETEHGIVWAMDNSQYCTDPDPGCGPAVLHAYDATNLTHELWNSSMVSGDAAGNAVKFAVPTVANGKVYIGTRGNNTGGTYGSTSISGELDVYGLKGG